jgi:hypothetical protein
MTTLAETLTAAKKTLPRLSSSTERTISPSRDMFFDDCLSILMTTWLRQCSWSHGRSFPRAAIRHFRGYIASQVLR